MEPDTGAKPILKLPWPNMCQHLTGEMSWLSGDSNVPIRDLLVHLLSTRKENSVPDVVNKHIVIDIETLGTGSRAAILEVGATVFDPLADDLPESPAVENIFYRQVDLQHELNLGFEVDASTIMWWIGQSEENRNRILEIHSKKSGLQTHTVLDNLTSFILAHRVKFIWAHGATFDPVILAEHFKRLKRDPPFNFRDVRDTRTLYAVASLEEETWKTLLHNPKKHHPVHDAWTHARAINYCLQLLSEDDDKKADDNNPGAGAVGQ